jgi:hypothetical protein
VIRAKNLLDRYDVDVSCRSIFVWSAEPGNISSWCFLGRFESYFFEVAMKRILHSLFLLTLLTSVPAITHAQAWRAERDRAIAPPSISGDPTGNPAFGGFEAVCHQGEWIMYMFGLPSLEGAPVRINVDGRVFPSKIVYGIGSEGIPLSGPILDALKAGRQVQISSHAPPHDSFNSTFTLRGSARALDAVERNCGYPTPKTAPDRFKTTPAGPNSQAITLASVLLQDILAEAHQSDPAIGIESTGFVDLDDGWRFLISHLGPSTKMYGIAAFETVVYAAPPGQDWRFVARQAGFVVHVDSKSQTNGYPDLVYQSVLGVNQPYAVWSWNGQAYAFARLIGQ